jgi:hypothetical protein
MMYRKKCQLVETWEAEEDLIEKDIQVIAEIEEARKAYQKGDYKTIQEYIAGQSRKN